jgi:putative glutamine amidotransferase
MPKLATWIRPKDEKWFAPFFAPHPELTIANACAGEVTLDDADGLLLTGGPDISQEFLRQPVPDPSVLEKDSDAVRDKWEFAAVRKTLELGIPILAVCKGLQVLNVALGGTLKLDIRGHNLPEQKDHDIQPLRIDRHARQRFAKVNSSHHQAVDQLADRCEVEAWCATDDIIEQFRVRDYPYALAVQYHPERSVYYAPLFEDFIAHVKDWSAQSSRR